MSRQIRPFILFCALALSARVNAAAADAGQPGAYLRLGVGARAAALADAYAALAEGPGSAYWNPAAVAWARRPALGSSLSVLSLGRHYNSAALQMAWDPAPAPPEGVLPLSQRDGLGAWSVAWLGFSLGDDFEGRTADTASYYKFADRQNAYLLSHGRPLTPWLALGGTLKVYDRQIEQFSANGLGGDLGALVLLGPNLRLGVSASDLLGRLRWSTGYEENLPVVLRSSVAVQAWSRLRFAGQLTALEGRSWEPNLGLELEPFKGIAARAGWKPDGICLGAGVAVTVKTIAIKLDYAFLPDPLRQGDAQRLEVQIYF